MKKVINYSIKFTLSLALLSCSSTAPITVNNDDQPVSKYMAWLEGDLQNNYEPDRKLASTRLEKIEGNEPSKENTEEYLDYLTTLDAAGKVVEAEKKLKQFLVERPSEKRAVFILAVHYLRKGKKELGNYFLTTLENDKEFPWKSLLYNNFGMLALKEGNRNSAIGYFEKAVKEKPETAAPLVNLGSLYLQSRSYSDALTLFTKAKEIDSDFEDAVLGLGVSLEGLGKFDEAAKVYEEHLGSHGKALSVLFNHAALLGNKFKKREEAAQLMLRYIQSGGKETNKAHALIQSWK